MSSEFRSESNTNERPKKRSLFRNRPIWAGTDSPNAAETDLFRRTVKPALEVDEDEDEAELAAGFSKSERENGLRSTKKRRAANRPDSSGSGSGSSSSSEVPLVKKEFKFKPKTPLHRSTPRSPASENVKSPSVPAPVSIQIDDDSEDDVQHGITALRSPETKQAPPVPEIDSDEEIAQLARRARERREREKQINEEKPDDDVEGNRQGNSADVRSPQKQRSLVPSNSTDMYEPIRVASSQPPDNINDPVLQILVHSRIPNTKVLIIKRRLNQRLQQVREAWCGNQDDFTEEISSQVALYWRNHKVFDSSTCASLGMIADQYGDIKFKGQEHLEGPDQGRIEMEALTPDIAEADKQAARLARTPLDSVLEDEPEVGVVKTVTPAGPRITLRAKGMEEFKLRVKDTTKIGQLVRVFRSHRPVPEDATISMVFEGEKLDEDSSIADCDVNDTDFIDVHIR